jgi:hypothetical protein
MSKWTYATFITLCGCTQQIWLLVDPPPETWLLPLKGPMVATKDAPPVMVEYSRTFHLKSFRRDSYGDGHAEYLEEMS